ncbi:MAG: hypothetical protein BGO78_12875 [Chloroflexi bacterium 44-23]|nr:MAG: hypothetical protein BGO78_12875 [Chloroflexi bacterium 44-23]
MFSNDNLVKRLGKVSHFKNLSPAALFDIVRSGSIEHHNPGKVIFLEGEPCAGLYVLFRGRVNLCKISRQGQETIINVIRPVIMFNEVPVLDGGLNPVTAIADLDSIVWRLRREAFQELTISYPVIAMSLLPVLAARNRVMLSYCEDISFRSVKGRTAKILLDLSQNGQKNIDRIVYNNQTLSAMVATVPEPLCRAMRELRELDAIYCSRSQITITDPTRLAQVAELVPDCRV